MPVVIIVVAALGIMWIVLNPIKYARMSNYSNKKYRFNEIFDGLAKVKKKENGKFGFVDKDYKEVIPCIYDEIFDFDKFDDFVKVERGLKFGYIYKNGKEVIPCQYDEILYFDDNLLKVKKEDKFGFIDKDGKELISCIYDEIYYFDKKLIFKLFKDKECILSNKHGEILFSGEYDDIVPNDNQY